MIHIALYQPEIPYNIGAMMRVCACFGVPLHLVGPLTFPWNPQKWKRMGMDYQEKACVHRYESWQAFLRGIYSDFDRTSANHTRDVGRDLGGGAAEAVAFPPLYEGQREGPRLIGLTPRRGTPLTDFVFEQDDILLGGTESCGFPEELEDSLAYRVAIPMVEGCRSLNVGVACAMVLGAALGQTRQWPGQRLAER